MVSALYIAVSYRTTLEALSYAACFDSSPNSAARTRIVDNSEGELAGVLAAELARKGSSIQCISSGVNLGYFGGARLGLKVAADRGSSDWIVVSNVDLQFDPTALERELAGIDPESVGVIAPRIIATRSGLDLNPFMTRRPPRLRMHFYKWVFRPYYLAGAYGMASEALIRMKARHVEKRVAIETASAARDDQQEPMHIYAPHGAFMIFSRAYFTRGGSLEHTPFLFGEEITVAERARSLALPVLYCPTMVVHHVEHASMASLPSRHAHRFMADAAAHSADNYF